MIDRRFSLRFFFFGYYLFCFLVLRDATGLDRRRHAGLLLLRPGHRLAHRLRQLQPVPQQRLQVGWPFFLLIVMVSQTGVKLPPPPEGNMTPGTLDSPKNALKIFANIWCSGCKWIYDVNNVYKLAGNFLSYIHGFPNLGSNYPLEGNMTPDTLDSQKLLSKYLRKGGVRTARSFTMLTA